MHRWQSTPHWFMWSPTHLWEVEALTLDVDCLKSVCSVKNILERHEQFQNGSKKRHQFASSKNGCLAPFDGTCSVKNLASTNVFMLDQNIPKCFILPQNSKWERERKKLIQFWNGRKMFISKTHSNDVPNVTTLIKMYVNLKCVATIPGFDVQNALSWNHSWVKINRLESLAH